jgi:hypothetical protein
VDKKSSKVVAWSERAAFDDLSPIEHETWELSLM